jgi:penicillin-binding protein 2
VPLTEQQRRTETRLDRLQYLTIVVFALLAFGFWVLQGVQHQKFLEMAENNHQRTLSLRAPRGVVFDRDGHVLVENRRSFGISIVREHTRDLDRTIRLLSDVLDISQSRIREIVDRHRREPAYRPIRIVQDATLAQVAAVTARRLDFELPDVVVEPVPTRRYPHSMAAHLFGYVGEANDTQVSLDAGLKSGDIVGQSGIEKSYNALLMGDNGARRVVVNSLGREMRTLEEVEPTEGKRLKLTIDADVQRAVEDAFEAFGYRGAAVVMDPSSGEVLALTSLPAYDPNAFAAGIDRATWTSLNTDDGRPLQDRAIQGRYSPGSTFKMAVAVAALEEGIITPDFRVSCPGYGSFFGRAFRCWKSSGHGSMDLRHAIEQSCNVYFYTIGNMTGIERIHRWATRLGLGVKSGVDLPNEVQGIVPSPEWKRNRTGEKWYAGETISVAIGQGQVSLTPMSMAVYISTIANGGTRVTPHLLKAVDEGQGWKDVEPRPSDQIGLKAETVKALREGLWMVVNGAGTGGRARIAGSDVAGKTGTAQVISLEGAKAAAGRTKRDLRDHGWFVFFAPRDNPQIAGVVFAEHAEHGSSAAPIAKHAMATFFAKRDGLPLPPPPSAPAPAAPAEERRVPLEEPAAADPLLVATSESEPSPPANAGAQP